jgi:putative multiple sugar transport system substrate-binding protein
MDDKLKGDLTMKRTWKSISVLLVVMLVTALMAACSDSSGGSSKVSVGIVLPTKDEPRWVQDEQRFKDALSDSKYTTEILFSQGSSAKEKENVETLLNKGIEVLIITPHDGAAAASAVEAAKKEGVTVISYDRLITNTDAVDYYVTFDSVAVGAAQGQYLIDNSEGKFHCTCMLVHLLTITHSYSSRVRGACFNRKLQMARSRLPTPVKRKN